MGKMIFIALPLDKILQETNEEFKKMSIIQTPPEKNDSNQYIDYITFTNENGSLEVLCCD